MVSKLWDTPRGCVVRWWVTPFYIFFIPRDICQWQAWSVCGIYDGRRGRRQRSGRVQYLRAFIIMETRQEQLRWQHCTIHPKHSLPIWADERFNLACNRSRPMSLLFAVSPQSAQSLGIPNNIADDKTREYLKAAKNLWWTYRTRRRWQRLEGGEPTIVAGPCQGKVWGSPTGHQGPVVEIGLLIFCVVLVTWASAFQLALMPATLERSSSVMERLEVVRK